MMFPLGDVTFLARRCAGEQTPCLAWEDWMTRIALLSVALAAIVIGGCSKTEGTKPEPATVGTGGAGADVKSDSDFVHDVALKNMAAMELSRMALDKATSPEIKAFA